MKKSTLALAVMAMMGSGAVLAAPLGGTSNSAGVAVGASNHSMFGGGNSGVALNGDASRIDLAGGPIKGSNKAIAARGNGTIMKPADVGMFPLPINIAQVWKASASNGGAQFAINSVRQITQISLAPQFGGLVIGQVANASGAPLAVGSGVYFGEWAPRAAGTPPSNSTNLNMTSTSRTVWYVGDNAVAQTPGMTNVQYNVIGINQTGTDASGATLAGGLPASPNLYKGTLTANYNVSAGTGGISGALTRTGSANVDFANTVIRNNGTFIRGSVSNPEIEGRFYNSAQALAGIHKAGAGVADDVAFGGSKVSGTITP